MSKNSPTSKLAYIASATIAGGVALFSRLGAIGLAGPDEPRYAWIARAMAQTGDWVTPRLYGQPWFEKPILYYWTAAIGFKFIHSAEWAARLPSAIAALCAAIAVAWLAWKHYGAKTAWLVLMIFPTTVAAIGFSRAAGPDMLFSAALTLTMASAAGVLREHGAIRGIAKLAQTEGNVGQSSWTSLVWFGGWLGVAMLAKGPSGPALVGGSIALWMLTTRQWRAAFRLAHPIAVFSFFVVAAPWYVLCALRNPDFLRTFFWLHNVERYLTPIFQHKQPSWFFGPIVLLGILPWTLLLWLVGAEGLRSWREESWHNSPGYFFICWAVFPAAFFSLSQSKLPGYILPAIPPLVLACAASLNRGIESGRRDSRLIVAGAAVTLGLIGFILVHAARTFTLPYSGTSSLLGIWLASLAAAIAALLGHERLAVGIGGGLVMLLLMVGSQAMAVGEGIPHNVATVSARAVLAAPQVRDAMESGERMLMIYKLDRRWEYGLDFYAGRVLPAWSEEISRPAIVFTNSQGAFELDRLARVTHVVHIGSPSCEEVIVDGPGP